MKTIIEYFLNLFFPLFKEKLSYQVYAYLAVGAANTVLNILIFALFLEFILPQNNVLFLGFSFASYTIGLLVAFFLTIPTGFWLSKNFAFINKTKTHIKVGGQIRKYFAVVLQGLCSDYLILKGLIIFIGLHPTPSKIISTVIVVTLNFYLQKYYTFKGHSSEKIEFV